VTGDAKSDVFGHILSQVAHSLLHIQWQCWKTYATASRQVERENEFKFDTVGSI